MMSGQCLAQQNTQCDQGTGTVLRRTQGSTPGLWGQSQGISTKAAAAAAQEPPCNDEFAQGNREKSFFRDVNSSEMSQLIFPLVTPEQNQWCPGSSRKILPNELQGLGIDFFFTLSSVVKNIHSPQWDPLLKKGPFSMRSCRLPPAPNSSISDLS